MLTLTPPETREDEIQVDETERDSILLRLSPTRVKAKSRKRNAHGFNYIQLIVGMIIFVALSRIVGPPAFRMITRARSTALNANIQTAAETVRNVLAIDPAKRGTPLLGVPQPTFLAALTDDAPFNWEAVWALDDDDDADTIKIQFIGKATVDPADGTDPPDVTWLLNAWDAVRIQARNQDGAWVCALVVLKPNTEDGDKTSLTAYNSVTLQEVQIPGTAAVPSTPVTVGIEKQLADARLRGVWYDSGDTDSGDVDHCDPVGIGATSTVVTDPIPEAADTWTIPDSGATAFRTLTRNV